MSSGTGTVHNGMLSSNAAPLPGTAWLTDRLLIGIRPQAVPPSRDEVAALLSAGVTVFAYLEFTRAALDTFDTETKIASEGPVTSAYWLLPFDDRGVPNAAKFPRCIAILNETLGSGATVYLHPSNNPSHAALVAAAWLVMNAPQPEQAVVRIEGVFASAVFNHAQRAFLHNYAARPPHSR